MADCVDTIYVSGWQCASTAATSNEPGPDLADYPYDTVPNKVDQLFRAQEFHDRRQRMARSKMTPSELASTPEIDFFRPLIADADTGHGGLSAVAKLTKLFVEAGAAGIHLEDQKAGTKKCGHLGGKVLVSTQEHVDRLIAARLQADIMQSELLIVARSDAEAAKYLDNNVDPRDHPFIVGELRSSLLPQPVQCTLPEAAERLLKAAGRAVDYRKEDFMCALPQALARLRELLRSAGDVQFDWEKCRSREGFYRIRGGVEFAAQRGIAFAPYADLLWMETASPNAEEAREFSTTVRRVHPHQMLAYNLSPSFNWDAAQMTDDQIRNYTSELASMGFCWQFITLAGFHVDGLAVTRFARAYAKDKMLAYVTDVQREERKHKVPLLKHQEWSGVDVVDKFIDLVTGGQSCTKATGDGITEAQFSASTATHA